MKYWPFILVLGIVFIGCALMYESDDSDATVSGSGSYNDPFTYINIGVSDTYLTWGYDYYNNPTPSKYVRIGSQITIYNDYVDEDGSYYEIVNVTGGHGLSVNNGLSGTLTGNPGESITFGVYWYIPDEDDGSATFTIILSSPPTYTVSLYSGGNGSVSGSGTYTQGSTATITATPNTGYHFTNWSDGNTSASRSFTVTGNVSLTAYFAINTYTVAVSSAGGGTVSGGGTYNYGSTATITATPNTGYHFTNWSDGNNSASRSFTVTSNVSLTAYFAINTYTVTWNNWDGTTLETDYNVPYGTTPTYNSATPTKPSTAQYSYTFTGWNPTVESITDNTTYTAQFSQSTRTYTITWNNWDGTTLETDNNVAYGATPSYDGSTPTRTADAQYTYTFTGWDPTVAAVTEDATYTAQYSTTLNDYTVTWNNWDGTTLETDNNVAYGATPSYDGATPTKPMDAQYTYTFSGWSPSVGAITGNTTYTAQFTDTLRSYTITWVDWDETVLETDLNVPYGTTPTYDSVTPTRTSTAQYSYSFSGWSPAVASVTGDVTYTAQYTETLRSYTITWVDWDETVLETDTTDYGDMPSYDGATPTRPTTAQYTYTFSGWSPTVSTVTGDATYTAQYSATVNTYTVTWLNWDETVLETDSDVPYGTTPTYDGSAPTKSSTVEYVYTFSGWNPAVAAVTGDSIYTAQFTQSMREYTITWLNWDGSTLETDSTAYGTIPTYDGVIPTKPSTSEYMYTFTDWDPQVVSVTENATYTAQFTATALFTVIWKNWDGTVLETDVGVPDGTLPTYDGAAPTRPDTSEYTYTFNGWNPTVSPVTADTEYTAQYTATNLYTVVWRNWNGDVLETDTGVPDGSTPTYDGATPTRPDTESYTYTFSGWDPAVGPISGYTEYTAQYSATALYLVRWLNWDGTVLDSERITVGSTPVYHGETPEKPMTVQYQYAFTGWNPTIVPITEDTDYTAQYSQSYRDYTYEDWTYNILDSGNVIVVGYSGAGGVVAIPYSMDERVVTEIGDALKNDSSVNGVIIPLGVTTIAADAFSGSGITEVLNLSHLEIAEDSYGLNDATVHTSIPGWFYIADVEYTEKVPDNSSVSNMIRIIPILLIVGLVLIIARNRVDSR